MKGESLYISGQQCRRLQSMIPVKCFSGMWFKKKSDLKRKELFSKIAVSQDGGGKMTFLLLLHSQKECKWNILCAILPKKHKTRLKIVIKKIKRQKMLPQYQDLCQAMGTNLIELKGMCRHVLPMLRKHYT